jgi:transcriptional regulator with XRE-family HTH domain
MTPVQCKMARAALGWTTRDLGKIAKVSHETVARFENGIPLKERTVDALRDTLERAGIIFLPDDGESVGMRVKHASLPTSDKSNE